MKIMRRALALAACVTILAGCGGGGAQSGSVPSPSTNVVAASSGAKATATLTLRFPKNFHHAAFPVVTKKVTVKGKPSLITVASSTRRSPKYINPGNGNLIHVYAEVVGVYSLTEYTPTGGIALPSNANPDGSQTISVALPANYYYFIEVVEKDPTNANELASGYSYYQNIGAGSTNALTMVMDMNAQYVALTTDLVNGADATVINSSNFCVYNNSTNFYAFAADSTGGFVLPGAPSGTGYGTNNGEPAIPTPLLYGTTADIASTPLGMLTTFPSPNITTNATFVENNPDPNIGGTTYAYATIGNSSSYPCTLNASFSEDPANVGDSVITTISGGNAPYNVTETDGYCTVQQNTATTWTLVPQIAGQQCDPTLTDKNAGNTGTSYLTVNAVGPPPLTFSPSISCFSATNQTNTVTINNGVPPYMVSAVSDPTVFTTNNITSTSFDAISGTNYNGVGSYVTVTDSTSNSGIYTANSGC